MEPSCLECRRTWNTECAYSAPSAGTVQALEETLQARIAEKEKQRNIERNEEQERQRRAEIVERQAQRAIGFQALGERQVSDGSGEEEELDTISVLSYQSVS